MRAPVPQKSSPSESWITYITGEEVYGDAATLEEVASILRSLPRLKVTVALAKIASLCNPDDFASWLDSDKKLRSTFLDPLTVARIATDIERVSENKRITFWRQQILLALRLAQKHCLDTAVTERSESEIRMAIGRLLLKVSDLLARVEFRPNMETASQLSAVLLPLFDNVNKPQTLLAISRTYELVRAAPWNAPSALAEAHRRFETSAGLPLKEYLFSLGHICAILQGDVGGPRHGLVDINAIFSAAKRRVQILKAVDQISLDFASLPDEIGDPALDLEFEEPFRSRPLIRLPNGYYLCADLAYLIQRISLGVQWTLVNQFPISEPKRRESVMQEWAQLFERYCHDRIENLIGRSYVANPRDKESNELTDAIVREGRRAVLLEYKAPVLPERVKRSRDVAKISAEIEAKLLKDSQIVRSLQRMMPKGGPQHALLDGVEVLFPIIVSLDGSVCAPGWETCTSELVSNQLSRARLKRHPRIKPLTVMSADDLQLMIPLLQRKIRLTTLLEGRFAEDPKREQSMHNYLRGIRGRKNLLASGSISGTPTFFDDCRTFLKEEGLSE